MLEILLRKSSLILFGLLCLWLPTLGSPETFRAIRADLAAVAETASGGE